MICTFNHNTMSICDLFKMFKNIRSVEFISRANDKK